MTMPHTTDADRAAAKPGPRHLRGWALGAVALAAAAALAWHAHAGDAASASGAHPADGGGASGVAGAGRHGGPGARPQAVSVTRVAQQDLPLVFTAMGTVTPANTAVVRAKVSGELQRLFFQEGQRVQAGQVLAQIDPRAFQIALAQAQAQLVRDQAQLANARIDLTRYQDLVNQAAAPTQQRDTQAALVQQLTGTVQADQAAVDNARLQLSYTRVTAPLSGLVGLKQADLGNVVGPTDANGLLSIAQMQPAALVFAVPEEQLPGVRQGLGRGEALVVQAWDRSNQHLLAQGRLASTDNAIDTSTGTVRLKALFPNADNSLFANQFVNVRLQVGRLPQATTVPVAAVQRGAPGSYVYVVDAQGVAHLRVVQVRAVSGDTAAIDGPVKAGEQVVLDGADRLRDGGSVTVIAPQGQRAGASAGPRDPNGHHAGADGRAS